MSVIPSHSSDMMLSHVATLTTLATFTTAAPEAYRQEPKEARGLMDEALKKFYFDLYDQDEDPVSPGPGHSEGHSFKFDDYFDLGNNDNMATIVTPAVIGKKKDSLESTSINNRNTKLAPFPLPPPRNSLRLPVAPSQSQVAAPPSPASSSQDPTFVLSRLLFHLSQLPSSIL